MNRFFLLLVLIFLSGGARIFAQPWINSPNPMAQYYKEKGWPAWSDAIQWNNRINMATYANGANDFQKFENARDELALQGGGVLYYPAGTYNFADHPTGPNTGRGLMLKKGVVILGEKPTLDTKAVVDSVTPGLSMLGTKFLFPFIDKPAVPSGTGKVPDPWNMIGLYADANETISQQNLVGMAWVNLVGAYVYFGPDLDWSPTWGALNMPPTGGSYRKARWSKMPGQAVAWNERIPNGTHPGDPMFGAIQDGQYHHGKGQRFIFGCRFDDCAVTDEYMELYKTASGVRSDSVDATTYHTYRFSSRLNLDGANVFVANNALTKSDKNFYYNQKIQRHSQVVSGSPFQTKTILFDYAKQGGIDVNKALITRAANRCNYLNGPYVEENVVVLDNFVFSHGHKGYEMAGKWMIVKENYNSRIFLSEGDNIYNIPPSGQSPVYELTLDGVQETGVNSDNMSRAFDVAGWCAWFDRNWYQGTGSNPGNDGEGILLQTQGGVGFLSMAQTFNRQGPTGKEGYIAPWDVPVYGMFQGWNRQRGGVGLYKPDANRVEDAFAVQNFHPTTGAPNPQGGLNGTNIGDLSFTCPAGTPTAPDSIVVTPDFERSCMKIRWKDQSDNEVAFRIDRRVAGAPDWVTITYRPANVTGSVVTNWQMRDLGNSPPGCFHPGTMDLNPQEWYDYLAVPGEFYEYRVVAVNCENDDVGTTNVSPTIQFPVSVNTKVATPSVQVFPNPTGHFLQISGMENLRADQIGIFTTEGKKMEGFSITTNGINVESLPSGLYLLKISDGNGGRTKRFMKH
jgi:hypothetical protein